jgi:hypothetical protein
MIRQSIGVDATNISSRDYGAKLGGDTPSYMNIRRFFLQAEV